jgi:hypothetical protein
VDLKRGEGYRLGWKSEGEYGALVGTEDWACELTHGEFREFRRLALALAEMMASMALMEEETLACELESGALWMEVEGFPQDYALRFILQHERAVEGEWKAAIGLIQALEKMDPDSLSRI